MSLILKLNRRNVVNNIAVLLSGSAIAQGLTMLALLLTARQLGAVKYGEYVSAYTLASAAAIFFNLGLDIWLLREGGRHPNSLSQIFGSTLTIKFVSGFAWLLGMVGIAMAIPSGTFQKGLLQLSALTVWLDALFINTLTAFKARLDNKINSFLEATSDFVWLLLTWILVSYSVSSPEFYLGIRALVLLISLGVAILVVFRKIKIVPNNNLIQKALKECRPYATSEFLAWAAMRQDILIIALTLGTEAVGLYSPAVSVVNALFLIPAAVYVVMLPVLSNLFKNHPQQAWKTATRNFILLFFIGIGLWVGLWVATPFLIMILGSSFNNSLEILRTLSIIIFLHSLSFGMASVLVATNQQRSRTIVQTNVVLLNALLNFGVVFHYGISGIAKVYIISEVILLTGYSYLVLRYYHQSRQTANNRHD